MLEATQFQRMQALFDAALELPIEQQDEFLMDACADDAELRDKVLRLLQRQRRNTMLDDAPALPALESTLRKAIPDAFSEGRQVGAYRLVDEIGDGGMGRVYRAVRKDGDLQQEVAIKLVRAELLNPALLNRFTTERRLLASLNHPGICRFLDAGAQEDGTPYVAMELVRGLPLFDYCDQQRLTIAQRLLLLRKICAAVAHAHRNLIVHRDIKSSNVLVDERGEPKLLDFGIAKSIAGEDKWHRTATAERFLSPAHAAPEQLRGDPIGVGCDIYALGLLAYSLLAGRPPFDFDGLRAGEIERLLLDVPPPLMSQRAATGTDDAAQLRGQRTAAALAKALNGDLDSVIAITLRKAPGERYPSVDHLDAEFENVLQARPVRARHGDRGYRLSKFVARHRLAVALTALLTLVTLAGAGIVTWQAVVVTKERNRALLERDRAQQVVALLQGAFLAADPARVAGEAVRVSEVLGAARPRIEALFDDQPELYASLAATIAQVELGMGNHASAAGLAERALGALARINETGAPEFRTLQLILGRSLSEVGDDQRAQAALDEVRRRDAEERPDWMVAQGRLFGASGRFEESKDLLQRAIDQLIDQGPDSELATDARWHLTEAHRASSDLQAALQLNAETLAWQRKALDEQHPRISLTRLDRVDLLRLSGQSEAALQEARETHRAVLQAYGPEAAMAGSAGRVLALALLDAGQHAEAVETMRTVLRVWTRTLGADHAQSIRTAYNIGAMLPMTAEHGAEAISLMRGAVVAAEARFGITSASTHYMRLGLAARLIAQDQGHDALVTLTSAAAQSELNNAHPRNRTSHLELLQQAFDKNSCADRSGNRTALRPCITARYLLAREGAMTRAEPG